MQMLSNEYNIDRPKKGMKNALLLLLGAGIVLVLVGVVYYFTKVNQAATSDSHQFQFTVTKGLSTRQIATELNDQKIINNKYIFIIYSDMHGAGDKIQAGDYVLNSNMSIAQVVDALTHGKVVSNNRSFTMIEGWSNNQIAKYLTQEGLLSSADELDSVLKKNNYNFKYDSTAQSFGYQGFLFPDTYILSKTGTANDLITKMLNNFENKVTDQMATDAQTNRGGLSKALILASIIEKEVGRNKTNLTADDLKLMQQERELVASVFYNRLSIDMPLESDATVNYITGKTNPSVTIDDTKIKSPYNTYLNKGLPPTPISNPGLGSIQAAIYPASSDYLYFLNAPDGTAYFAKTLAEQNANKAKYLK